MSKLLAGVVTIGLLLVSFGIIAGPFEKDADAEDAYVEYSTSEDFVTYTWWGIESPMATSSGTIKYTCLGSDGDRYLLNYFVDVGCVVHAEGLTVEDVIGDLPLDSFERTDKRVGIGGTVTYQWKYVGADPGEVYYILSGADVIDRIYGFDAVMDLYEYNEGPVTSGHYVFKNEVLFNTDGSIRSWTHTEQLDNMIRTSDMQYFVPDAEGDVITENTKFGEMEIILVGDTKVFKDSKIVYERYHNGILLTLSSTNIKL